MVEKNIKLVSVAAVSTFAFAMDIFEAAVVLGLLLQAVKIQKPVIAIMQ